ncbi:MAG: preprotein translocase subunit SecE [Pseudarcicella sp.]|nr:preprotein translocase subunit SecE [Pseudarcicella sp.]MBP6409700.1 preprotein translocase subunit SecE [Pseudarcicella sp.]
MNKLIQYVKDSWVEVTENVTWPKMAELQASSSLVLVASIIFALLVGLIDTAFHSGLDFYYNSIAK